MVCYVELSESSSEIVLTFTAEMKIVQEKQMTKFKEKLDKCVKEKLVEFCDVLDIPISKANTRKVS